LKFFRYATIEFSERYDCEQQQEDSVPFGAICRLTELPEWVIIYYKSQESGVCRSGMN
jgi:hypothetical protein